MGWKRRSKAASFSIYFLYSSLVVAPTNCSSPLASDGFKILDASSAPSAPPAPIMVWSSSRKSMTSPELITSEITALILSSNSPLYLEPATIPERSRVTTLLFLTVSGTSPSTIFLASPSTIAVFPTPGSPTKQGLFLVRLERIWITRLISSSRPTTGSSLPSDACFVRSLLYLSSVGVTPLSDERPLGPSIRISWGFTPMVLRQSIYIFLISMPMVLRSLMAIQSFSVISESRMCSVPTCLLLNLLARS